MKLTATREEILGPVQHVIGVVERRQTMPVLSNVLLSARDGRLSVTGTDLEVELVSSVSLKVQSPGDITVPGRKLLDILRALAEGVSVALSTEADRLVVRAGRSRFTLSTLPAAEFPVVEEINAKSIFGSGFFNSREQQLQMLADRAAQKLEEWLEENNSWFGVAAAEE